MYDPKKGSLTAFILLLSILLFAAYMFFNKNYATPAEKSKVVNNP